MNRPYRRSRRSRGRTARVLAVLAVMTLPGIAHDEPPPRLQPGNLDNGLFVEFRHPPVIRDASPFTIAVVVENMLGEDAILVERVRYGGLSKAANASRAVNQRLPSKRAAYLACQSIDRQIEIARRQGNRSALSSLLASQSRMLALMHGNRFQDNLLVEPGDLPPGGTSLRFDVAFDLVDAGVPRTLKRTVDIPVQPPLPSGAPSTSRLRFDVRTGAVRTDDMARVPAVRRAAPVEADSLRWFAGDQHVHTTYSMDAALLNGTTENAADFAAAAEAAGLDWIIVTDHSNVDFAFLGLAWFTPEQFALGALEAAAYTATGDFLALYGQEMGAGASLLLGFPAHYLAYPAVRDSTGYIRNPCSAYVVNAGFCENRQVIIDRVAGAGGIGFIAHPTLATLLIQPWDFGGTAVGWSGMEIWSNSGGRFGSDDATALDLWHELLRAVRRPVNGQLPERAGIPSRFPVGIGNSDAHTPGSIGAVFTYAKMEQVTRFDVVTAFLEGRAVASNGPLLFGHINGAGIGEVATGVDQGVAMDVTLQTTPEFGPVGDYAITINVDGVPYTLIDVPEGPDFSTTIQIDGLDFALPAKFVTIRADSDDGTRHAFTNPIWLELPLCTGDINDDRAVDFLDFIIVWLTLGACDGCPSDVNRDGLVNIVDLILVIRNAGPCAH